MELSKLHWIDTHTHLFDEEFLEDIETVIERSILLGVDKMMLPNIDLETIELTKALALKYPENCFAMMGIHPCSVSEHYKLHLDQIEKELFSDFKYYGVGEIGIDLHWDKTTENIQNRVFIKQCEWAAELNLPVSIHTRNATHQTIQLVKKMDKKPSGVFHCFSGSIEEAKEIIDLGFYLGIGGVVTYKNSTLGDIVKEIGLQHLVLETDSPYLPPTPHRGKRNESSYIPLIGEKLSFVFETTIENIAETTTKNARAVFGI